MFILSLAAFGFPFRGKAMSLTAKDWKSEKQSEQERR